MYRLRCLLVLTLALSVELSPTAVPAAESVPDAHEQAAAAMQRGDYAKAYCAWQPLAEAGDPEAQYALGWMYHNGYGLAIDDQQAEQWWTRAVEQGHVGAMFSLGSLYSLGSETVARDFAAALSLWARAATHGHEDARVALRQLAGRGIAELQGPLRELLAEDPELFGSVAEVKVSRANLRNGPSTDDRIVAVLEQGDSVVEFLRRGDWVKVGVGDDGARIGWIHSRLIGPEEQFAAGQR